MKIYKKFDKKVIEEGNRLLMTSCRKAIERSRSDEGAYKHVKCSFNTAKQLFLSIRWNNKKLYENWMTLTKNYLDHPNQTDRLRLRPTLDRIDSQGHYFINNLQVITFGQNASKARTKSA
ncbi:hypothetical protein [Rossellomorea aquimaris]|uniref:Uncharacterized protein n=1 Tax=Rossellomorea aquimaris TaxID=189382 RepID=A0A5D4TJ79_9BACI|nr:hypothetical protein [Rossellomorea aquimaris]TYS75923.1 hypothetical protein FZD05_19555 [Rossellomorea aquimaris]TYS81183.1 hypothetical protein FZC85_20130 [Rossellomorea aquimaris]